MTDIECPRPAYNRIVEAGLDKRILDAKDEVCKVMGSTVYLGDTRELVGKAKECFSQQERISDKREMYKEILCLGQKVEDDYRQREEVLIEHPAVLAFAVLGEEVLDYLKFGFPTRRSLEETITSFCLGEEELIRGWNNRYIWRNKDDKNYMTNGFHGDCHFGQVDVSGENRVEQGLFGDIEKFDAWKDVTDLRKGIGAHWESWNTYLMITLRYAQALDLHHSDYIENWRAVLDEVGSVGTITTEAMFGVQGVKWGFDLLVKAPIINKDTEEKLKAWPLAMHVGRETTYFPCVSEGKLLYLKEDEGGEIDLSFAASAFKNERFSPHIVYDEEDLPHLLRGIYRLFARDRSVLPKIMDRFKASSKS